MIEIAEAVGKDRALELVKHFGGLEIYVPKQVREGHRLAAAIGADAARALAGVFGGGRLKVPTLYHAYARKAAIASAEGSVSEIARRFGVTEAWVQRVRAPGRRADRED